MNTTTEYTDDQDCAECGERPKAPGCAELCGQCWEIYLEVIES